MAAKRNQRKQSNGSGLPWGAMILSFAVGAFVMFLLHIRDNVPADKPQTAEEEKTQQSAAVQPTFDFYTLLPEMEVMVDSPRQDQKPVVTSPPEEEAAEDTQERDTDTDSESFIVQVGSFKNQSDADGFRAKLAFLGIESKVQTVTVDDKQTWHRVQIGPIAGREQADAMQKQLQENDIDSLLLRAKHDS